MSRTTKWVVRVVVGLALLLALALIGLSQWAGTDDFRLRAQDQASRALGVPVQLGAVEISLFPTPAVGVHDVRIQTRPPLTLQRVEARPVWTSLLTGRPELGSLVVRHAVLPQQAIVALAAGLQKQEAGAAKKPASARPQLPRRIVLDRVTWVDEKAQKLTVDAEVVFEGELLPQTARIDVVEGRFAGARARLERQPDAWQLRSEIGGGTITGPLRLQSVAGGASRLSGELATSNVEVSALTAPSRTLTGKLEARTTLQADFKDPAALADALRSQTRFTVRNALLTGVDLAAAVRSLGSSRDGQTALDTLTGQVTTQGKVVHLTNLVATSGLISANGNVTLAADKSLSGRVTATVGSIVGVPLAVGGTLDAPSVNATGVALPGSGVASEIGKGIRGLFGR